MEAVQQKIREPIRKFTARLAAWLNQITGGQLSPDAVTLFGLAMHVPIAFLIATQHNYWAAGLLIVFGLFDSLDGALARLQNRSSPHGMLLDSTTDRMKEILLYVGAAYAIIASTDRPYLAVWAVAACGCSLLTSYINAIGDAVVAKFGGRKHETNKAFRGGLFPFEVRMFVLVLGLLSNRLTLAVIVVALGAAYTALSRLMKVFNKFRERDVQN